MYKLYTHIFLFLLLLVAGQKVHANYVFRNFNVSDGLSENTVKCIAQDEQGFMWLGTLNGLCRFDGIDFCTFRNIPFDSLSIVDNSVSALCFREGGLWVGTESGLDFFSIKNNCFYRCYQVSADGKISAISRPVKKISSVAGRIFVLDQSGYLYVHKKGRLFERWRDEKEYWYSVCPYKGNLLLALSRGGLYLIDAVTKRTVSRFELKNGVPFPNADLFYSKNQELVYIGYGMGNPTESYEIDTEYDIRKLETIAPPDVNRVIDYGNETLFGTNGKGLVSYRGKGIVHYTTIQNSNISSDVIQALFVDRDDNLWIGTYRDGINLYSSHFDWFKSFTLGKKQLSHKLVTAITGGEQKLYIGLDGGGLNVYDQLSGRWSSYTTQNSSIAGNNVLSLVNDLQYIWLGIYQKGLCRFSPKSGTFKIYPLPRNASVWEIKDDGEGYIWVIGWNVYLFDKRHESYILVDGLRGMWASSIAFGKDAVWISTRDSGIYKLDRKKRRVLKHYSKNSGKHSFPGNDIPYLFMDSKRRIWFSPLNSGLFRLEESDGTITSYGEKDGLTDQNVVAMQEDDKGYLWIGTHNGLFRFNPQTETFIRFGKEDDLPSVQINHDACFQDGSRMYFGSTNGLIYFNPLEINYNKKTNPIYFKDLRLLNNDSVIHINGKDAVEVIRLSHGQNFFTVAFSTPEFISPDKVHFSCRMEHFEEEWRDIKNARQVTYTNIPPGEYVFQVRQLDGDGKWSNEISCLQIRITPPWWRTGWAVCLWIVLATGILFLIYLFYRKQSTTKRLAQVKEMEKNMLQKDNEMKLRFFTNISHEFRTPLSLIISPLEILMKNEPNATLRNKLSGIYRNAGNLLNLVNQLLDFRKLEMNGEKLNLTYGDLIEFAEGIFQAFKETACNEQKDLTFSVKTEHLYMSFDKDKMRKIINNLLSNAFKYTLEGAQITLTLDKVREEGRDYASLRVSDTGIGIPADKLTHIFERFYQLNDPKKNNVGSGIGLHLVKEYTGLHSGKIKVESTLRKGSVFTVWIPLDLQRSVEPLETSETESLLSYACETGEKERKTVLIVEDNIEFRQFLTEQLEGEFHIVEAPDGEAGEQMALKELPDLIITDVMMPKVDGVELCKRIKRTIQTSHIPVILLTARASNEFILTGYEAGADEYISKPFNFEILLLRIRQLIKQQEQRKVQFKQSIEIKPDDITITSLDEKLVQNALRSIENNMNNTEYSIEDLSNDVGLSRTGLYQKIQSITGETPANFIRSVRLKRAAQLLCDTDFNISEIADRVGFGSIKYFNKHFKEEFGITPTQYRKSNVRHV